MILHPPPKKRINQRENACIAERGRPAAGAGGGGAAAAAAATERMGPPEADADLAAEASARRISGLAAAGRGSERASGIVLGIRWWREGRKREERGGRCQIGHAGQRERKKNGNGTELLLGCVAPDDAGRF